MKDVEVSESDEDGVDFEVEVTNSDNVAGVDRISYTEEDASATQSAVFATSVAGLASGTNFSLSDGVIGSLDTDGDGATIYVEITSTCNGETETYVIKITGVPDAQLESSVASITVGESSITVPATGTPTVADLYSALVIQNGAEDDTIEIKNSYNRTLAEDDDTTVTADMTVVVTIGGESTTYSITVED